MASSDLRKLRRKFVLSTFSVEEQYGRPLGSSSASMHERYALRVPSPAKRERLSKSRILAAAIDLADRAGIEPLTIRRLATELAAKPMALYHHVANKDEILDGMLDLVYAEMTVPTVQPRWREEIRDRSMSARRVLRRHTWAIPLMDTPRAPGEATLRHHDAVLGCLLTGGFAVAIASHAYALLDSYVFGFALQESNLPFQGDAADRQMAERSVQALPPDVFPHLRRCAEEHFLSASYDFADSFEFGLDLILDGLETLQRRYDPASEGPGPDDDATVREDGST